MYYLLYLLCINKYTYNNTIYLITHFQKKKTLQLVQQFKLNYHFDFRSIRILIFLILYLRDGQLNTLLEGQF